jgi:hypothetical protein
MPQTGQVTIGHLLLSVASVSDIPAVDSVAPNTYVVFDGTGGLVLGLCAEARRTQMISRSTNPSYNANFIVPVIAQRGKLEFTLVNYNYILSNEPLGTAIIDFGAVMHRVSGRSCHSPTMDDLHQAESSGSFELSSDAHSFTLPFVNRQTGKRVGSLYVRAEWIPLNSPARAPRDRPNDEEREPAFEVDAEDAIRMIA